MKRRQKLIAAAAIALALGAGIAPAYAYFTDSTEANGGLRVNVTPTTTITETYGNRTKHLVIKNTGTAPVFVRARVFSTEDYTAEGTGWTANGDYIDYGEAVAAGGGETSELTVTLNFPEGATKDDEFNVIVVYESTPAQYDSNGDPAPDWNYKLNTGTAEGGN